MICLIQGITRLQASLADEKGLNVEASAPHEAFRYIYFSDTKEKFNKKWLEEILVDQRVAET